MPEKEITTKQKKTEVHIAGSCSARVQNTWGVSSAHPGAEDGLRQISGILTTEPISVKQLASSDCSPSPKTDINFRAPISPDTRLAIILR